MKLYALKHLPTGQWATRGNALGSMRDRKKFPSFWSRKSDITRKFKVLKNNTWYMNNTNPSEWAVVEFELDLNSGNILAVQ